MFAGMLITHAGSYEEHNSMSGERALDATGMIVYGTCAISFLLFLLIMDLLLSRYLRGEPLCGSEEDLPEDEEQEEGREGDDYYNVFETEVTDDGEERNKDERAEEDGVDEEKEETEEKDGVKEEEKV